MPCCSDCARARLALVLVVVLVGRLDELERRRIELGGRFPEDLERDVLDDAVGQGGQIVGESCAAGANFLRAAIVGRLRRGRELGSTGRQLRQRVRDRLAIGAAGQTIVATTQSFIMAAR
jgi:hypothetical protein